MIREPRELSNRVRLAVLALAVVVGFSLFNARAFSASYRNLKWQSFGFSNSVATSLTPADPHSPELEPQGNDANYSTFKHTSSRHAGLGCTTCHQRSGDNSINPLGVNKRGRSGFPGHSACQSCHTNQFLTPGSPMCLICHTDVNSQDPPLKSLPAKFKESFNVKFDHAQHVTGSAKAKVGSCGNCHNRPLNRGAALSIPAGLSAHSQCYNCHTPTSKTGAGREMASCGVCHANQKYARVSANSRAFRQAFSHVQHGPRQRLECTSCHTVSAGAAVGRQVSSPRAAQHFAPGGGKSCGACHDGTPTFGGDLGFKDCKRCHTGTSFRFPT